MNSKDKTVPVEKCKPAQGKKGGVTTDMRLKYGRNMARVMNQKGSK